MGFLNVQTPVASGRPGLPDLPAQPTSSGSSATGIELKASFEGKAPVGV